MPAISHDPGDTDHKRPRRSSHNSSISGRATKQSPVPMANGNNVSTSAEALASAVGALALKRTSPAPANDVAQIAEGLGEMAAGAPLQTDGDDEEAEIGHADAVGRVLQRLFDLAADVHLVHDLAEFDADG